MTPYLLTVVLVASTLNAAPAQVAGPTDRGALERFVDSVVARGMAAQRIPGAAFCFVRHAEVFFCKGYGVADLSQRRPVVPESTIFRVGSISKVFTATAVVQLADRGRLDMTADVRSYLRGAQLADSLLPRVTAEQLLDHTAGFDEIRPGTQAASEDQVLPLAQFLRPRLISVFTPGEITSYSTYGMTLAGLLVEQISGLSFEEYLKRNIWTPLGMSRTSITVPVSQRPWVAVGYDLVRDTLVPQPWEWYHTTPASSVNATAEDMAKFMIAHLREGERDGARILSDRAARYMQGQHATVHPRLPGFALGFYEDYVGQLRVIEHGGQMAGFASWLVLVPQTQDGFIIMHHRENARMRDDLKWALLTRYYADARRRLPAPVAAPSFKERVALFTGRYAPTTSCHSCTPRSVPYILEVKPTADSTALLAAGNTWIEVEPFLFAQKDGTGYLTFRRGSSGAAQYMFAGGSWSWERLPD